MNEFYIDAGGIRARVVRKKVKCIRMYIKPPDGSVYISAPMRCSMDSVKSFVESKRAWIEEKQEQCRRRISAVPFSGQQENTVLLWGERLELAVTENASRDYVGLSEDMVVLCTSRAADALARAELLDGLYRRQLLERLPDIASKWQTRMGVKAEEWRTRRMKTRWGSCNVNKKRIWLNVRLAMLPQECLEYVVVHELCHLFEPAHNQRFWSLMSGFMPEWCEIRKRMNELSGVLY